jgi:transcriptional regulator with XRE-family HTH domain
MSQPEFGALFNIERNEISAMENGSRAISPKNIERFCNQFHLNPIEFYYDDKIVQAGHPIDKLKTELIMIYDSISDAQRNRLLELARERKLLSDIAGNKKGKRTL